MWGAIYGLDIETDTSELTPEELSAGHAARGLDPRIGMITSVAIAASGDVATWEASTLDGEARMLVDVHNYLSRNPTGLIVTWNGAVFDLPFLSDRYRRHHFAHLGPTLTYERSIAPKYEPLPGHEGGYAASWSTAGGRAAHAHLDLAYYVRNCFEFSNEQWGLKPFARQRGYEPVELDRTQMHSYSDEEIRNYVASDARITRDLALDLLPGLVARPQT